LQFAFKKEFEKHRRKQQSQQIENESKESWKKET